ncbi:MAG: UpxY family transcription antiterminator [Nitrospirae bacterium]|nr:UpxY family transcription antiterminator [Nitrospirota bacterium]
MTKPIMEHTNTLTPHWYAVHTRSRHEFYVYEKLKLKGVEAFLPAVERLRKWKDRKKLIEFPLFPGYIFVHIAKDSQSMLSVLKVKGVVRLLCTIPGEPAPIPDEQIASLQRLVQNKEALDPYPYLNEGQRVRIIKGPLIGVEGILVEKLDKHILVLSVDVLRQGVALTITASDVEKI